jgi:hypothetical protein
MMQTPACRAKSAKPEKEIFNDFARASKLISLAIFKPAFSAASVRKTPVSGHISRISGWQLSTARRHKSMLYSIMFPRHNIAFSVFSD